ncbi:MAG: hypothetical protein E7379_03555 [Clostridiales bacterium]|nr:hypothetical protein [Clostridiales bacterium]
MKGVWDSQEVKELFSLIERHKQENKPIKDAFALHASKYVRKQNSVRNYYYHEIDNLTKDSQRAKELNIDLSLHKKTTIEYFSKGEENLLMQEINNLKAQGLSTRRACLTLAGGNVDKLLRYQNKYRNYISKQKPSPRADNIIAFQKPAKGLSDSEVQSLFMGLVRLVKKNALLEGEAQFKQKLNEANDKLKKMLAQLHLQEKQIDEIKEKYIQLKKENQLLSDTLVLSRCDKAKSLRQKFLEKTFNKDEVLEK